MLQNISKFSFIDIRHSVKDVGDVMLSRLEKVQQQWGGSHNAIDNWLNERQEVLVSYCQLAGLPPFENANKALPNSGQIQSFCQLLMDYVSTGHFEVYDKIVLQSKQQNPNKKAIADELYPKISKTTDIALQFNDKYAENTNEVLNDFDDSLSALGQFLEERFSLEDKFIEALL